jgi:hypothetical protein
MQLPSLSTGTAARVATIFEDAGSTSASAAVNTSQVKEEEEEDNPKVAALRAGSK